MIKKRTLSERHRNALEHAVLSIKKSQLSNFVNDVILFGSCARGEQTYESDIDLLLILQEEFLTVKEKLRIPFRLIKCEVNGEELDDPDIDLKILIGDEWKTSQMTFYKNIRRDGISIWH